MDMHAEQIQGFFDIPVDNLFARSLLLEAGKAVKLKWPMVAAPDIGSIKLVRVFAEGLQAEYAVIDKRRVNAKQVECNALIGDIAGKDVVFFGRICSTGET